MVSGELAENKGSIKIAPFKSLSTAQLKKPFPSESVA